VRSQTAKSWEQDSRFGIVYGAVTNLDEIGWEFSDLFERLLDRPSETAATIEGPFVIACYDGSVNRYLLVTDKLGSRPCFYTTEDPFRFATAVSPLVDRLDSPSVDIQGVSDMILMGHLWGERTLVENIRTVRPATVMEITAGNVTSTRYWKPEYTEADPGPEYLSELARRYRQAARRTGRTLPATVGLWLSGGLDSRTTAAALLDGQLSDRFESMTAYTYDANPPTRDNPTIARTVADRLGMEFVEVPLTAETFFPVFESVIEATDGMIQWKTLVNLSATYSLTDGPTAMLEGMQGELVGDHPFRYHLYELNSVVQAQHDSEASVDAETVRRLLTPDVDPHGTFKAEERRSSETSHRAKVLDIHFQNYYARNVLASDRLVRQRMETRTPQVDGSYLEWCAKLPRAYRKGTFPFSERVIKADAGGVPYGTSRAKLDLCRRVAPSVADVTYERTQTKPSRGYPFHVAGFVANVVTGRLRGEATYGRGALSDFWLRDTSTDLHQRVTDLIDDACSRPLFDSDVVLETYDQHMDGKNNSSMLSRITTLEYWLQRHLD
jgi:asparagine synthase (glutamine-hydrolysing)